MNQRSRNEIYEFEDYRDFLFSRFESLRSKRKIYSFQWLGNKLEVSKTFVKLLLSKKRHIDLERVPQLSQVFKLTREEENYLTLLICKGRTEKTKIGDFFKVALSAMESHFRYPSPVAASSGPGVYDFFYSPLAVVIHALSEAKGFEPSVEWIKERISLPNTSEADIHNALTSLLKFGFIYKSREGWRKREYIFSSPVAGDIDGARIFVNTLSRVGSWMAEPEKVRPNNYYLMAIPCDEKGLQEVKTEFMKLRDRLIEISQRSQPVENVLFLANCLLCATK